MRMNVRATFPHVLPTPRRGVWGEARHDQVVNHKEVRPRPKMCEVSDNTVAQISVTPLQGACNACAEAPTSGTHSREWVTRGQRGACDTGRTSGPARMQAAGAFIFARYEMRWPG